MRVRDIMTTKVHTVTAEKKASVVQEIMEWARLRHVPVVDRGNHVIGVISQRDILQASLSPLSTHFVEVQRHQHLAQVQAGTIMHQPVQVIGPDNLVQEAAGLLRRSKIGCLPVVEQDLLVGIVTEYDLLHVLERLPSAVLDSVEPKVTC